MLKRAPDPVDPLGLTFLFRRLDGVVNGPDARPAFHLPAEHRQPVSDQRRVFLAAVTVENDRRRVIESRVVVHRFSVHLLRRPTAVINDDVRPRKTGEAFLK